MNLLLCITITFCFSVKNHTMVCKACNSYVHNRNDMTLLHLNKCFNGKFNDDHCSIENYLYCFSCRTIISIHNNKKCKFDVIFLLSVT